MLESTQDLEPVARHSKTLTTQTLDQGGIQFKRQRRVVRSLEVANLAGFLAIEVIMAITTPVETCRPGAVAQLGTQPSFD